MVLRRYLAIIAQADNALQAYLCTLGSNMILAGSSMIL